MGARPARQLSFMRATVTGIWILTGIVGFVVILSLLGRPKRQFVAQAVPGSRTPDRKNLGALYHPSPKIWGPSHKKFWGPRTCKIWADFTQFRTLITNISGKRQDIQNRKDM